MFDRRTRAVGARVSLAVAFAAALIAGGIGAQYPAAAAAALAQIASAVACSTSAACVSGSNSTSGAGVAGSSKTGSGVTGTGSPGITGTGLNGVAGIIGSGTNGVRGIATTGFGTKGQSTSGFGAQGISSSSHGVDGTSTTSVGVFGTSTSGIAGVAGTGPVYGLYGFTANGSGVGVVGTSEGGTGVSATASSGVGINATADSGISVLGSSMSGTAVDASTIGGGGTAVYARAGTGYGVESFSNGSPAVFGKNSAGNGADVQGSYIGVIGRAPSNGFPLVLTDANGNNLMYVDGAGDLRYHGSIGTFAQTGGGRIIASFSPQAAAPTVEDTGTAQLVGGSATVRLDPVFAASVDMASGYRVFITPDGDTPHGLFVALKSAGGFIVREAQAGRSNVAFDYRIVATALGQSGKRMTLEARELTPLAPRLNPTAPAVKAPARVPALLRSTTKP